MCSNSHLNNNNNNKIIHSTFHQSQTTGRTVIYANSAHVDLAEKAVKFWYFLIKPNTSLLTETKVFNIVPFDLVNDIRYLGWPYTIVFFNKHFNPKY